MSVKVKVGKLMLRRSKKLVATLRSLSILYLNSTKENLVNLSLSKIVKVKEKAIIFC